MDRQTYETEALRQITEPFVSPVLAAYARRAEAQHEKPGISDDDQNREFRAMKMVADARSLIQNAMALTDMRKGMLLELLQSDGWPDELAWDEAVNEARRWG